MCFLFLLQKKTADATLHFIFTFSIWYLYHENHAIYLLMQLSIYCISKIMQLLSPHFSLPATTIEVKIV